MVMSMSFAGEVIVVLSQNNKKTAIITTYNPGETINFFHGNSVSCNSGGLVYRNLKLSLQFRSTKDSTAQVLGMDRGESKLKPVM